LIAQDAVELGRGVVVAAEAAETGRNGTCSGSCLDLFEVGEHLARSCSVMRVAEPQSCFCSRLQDFSPELMHYSIDHSAPRLVLLRNRPSCLFDWGFIR